MSTLLGLNPKADLLRAAQATGACVHAANGLAEVMAPGLGPKGSLKMLVGGAFQIKTTKDGNTLLKEMQIKHPVASLIARAASAQDAVTGDGSTTTVLVMGELMKLAEQQIAKGVHPRVLCSGLDVAREEAIRFLLEEFKIDKPGAASDRELLCSVARCSLSTKLDRSMTEKLTNIIVDSIFCLMGNDPNSIKSDLDAGRIPLDLFMVEVLTMKQGLASETKFVRGMVMDHGCRHPDMPSSLKNCYVLTCNVSLEYEKTEVNSGFFYSSAEQRARLAEAERRFTDMKVKKIIELKRQVCDDQNKKGFVVFNQKGIDPPSLDMLAREGIMALRRVKRRNMERLTLCCGGNPVNAVEDLTPEDLGFAEHVWEISQGDEKYTFVEGVENPRSCCILVKGPNDHEMDQIKDAIRDGLRAVRNVIMDRAVVPGAGAFEIACAEHLRTWADENVQGRTSLGVNLLGDALLIVPRLLAKNAGLDAQDTLLTLQQAYRQGRKTEKYVEVGVDLDSGKAIAPSAKGIFDTVAVKRQNLILTSTLCGQLLLVDEIIKAGKQMNRG